MWFLIWLPKTPLYPVSYITFNAGSSILPFCTIVERSLWTERWWTVHIDSWFDVIYTRSGRIWNLPKTNVTVSKREHTSENKWLLEVTTALPLSVSELQLVIRNLTWPTRICLNTFYYNRYSNMMWSGIYLDFKFNLVYNDGLLITRPSNSGCISKMGVHSTIHGWKPLIIKKIKYIIIWLYLLSANTKRPRINRKRCVIMSKGLSQSPNTVTI